MKNTLLNIIIFIKALPSLIVLFFKNKISRPYDVEFKRYYFTLFNALLSYKNKLIKEEKSPILADEIPTLLTDENVNRINKLKRQLKIEEFKIKALTILNKNNEEKFENLLSEKDEKYRDRSKEALIFGVDFEDKKYASKLKGREFENLVVTNLGKSDQFEILEWALDKGINLGITVKSNTNPDLVIKDKSGNIFAIECKYRSDYYTYDGNDGVTWSYPEQLERYDTFSENRKIIVYMAIGILGNASEPKYHRLIDIQALKERSSRITIKGKNMDREVCFVPWSAIGHGHVDNGDYASSLKKLV